MILATISRRCFARFCNLFACLWARRRETKKLENASVQLRCRHKSWVQLEPDSARWNACRHPPPFCGTACWIWDPYVFYNLHVTYLRTQSSRIQRLKPESPFIPLLNPPHRARTFRQEDQLAACRSALGRFLAEKINFQEAFKKNSKV